MIWLIVWVFLMLFWLFGGGWYIYSGPSPNPMAFGTGTLIPWLCVLILGLVVFGAFGPVNVNDLGPGPAPRQYPR